MHTARYQISPPAQRPALVVIEILAVMPVAMFREGLSRSHRSTQGIFGAYTAPAKTICCLGFVGSNCRFVPGSSFFAVYLPIFRPLAVPAEAARHRCCVRGRFRRYYRRQSLRSNKCTASNLIHLTERRQRRVRCWGQCLWVAPRGPGREWNGDQWGEALRKLTDPVGDRKIGLCRVKLKKNDPCWFLHSARHDQLSINGK